MGELLLGNFTGGKVFDRPSRPGWGCARAQKNPHRLMRVFWCPGVCCCLSTQGAVPHRPRTIIRAQIIAVAVIDGGGQADRHGIDPTPVSGAAQQLRQQPRL